jgi:hypothetical protein
VKKGEMAIGLAKGRTLVQEEWSSADEIRAVNELVEEGKATVTDWKWKDGFQCDVRFVRGIF